MKRRIVLDTGPLAAFLNVRDRFHDWAKAQWAQIQPPMLICEAVVSEACFLLRGWNKGSSSIFELLERGGWEICFCVADQIAPVSPLMKKYGFSRLPQAQTPGYSSPDAAGHRLIIVIWVGTTIIFSPPRSLE